MNWNQTGMPSALVGQLVRRRESAELRSVLNDARDHIMQPVDVEAMAVKLMEAGCGDFVTLVKGLTEDLANAKRELENANRRCERLTAELAKRGIDIDGEEPQQSGSGRPTAGPAEEKKVPPSPLDGQSEWEEWDRRFRALIG